MPVLFKKFIIMLFEIFSLHDRHYQFPVQTPLSLTRNLAQTMDYDDCPERGGLPVPFSFPAF
jgi:hypothetical protein